MELYSNHVIRGRIILPGAGYIEMGLAAGALVSTRGIGGGIELLDMKFIHPLDLEAGCKMVSTHYFEAGMDFCKISPGDSQLRVASIANIITNPSASSVESLDDLKHHHTRRVMGIQEHYVRLSETSYHRGSFQSIKVVLLNEEGKSALGHIGLPEGFEHVHDGFYYAHPAVLDGAFQLIGFVSKSREGQAWFPAGISRVAMYHAGELQNQKHETWAHLSLLDDCSKSDIMRHPSLQQKWPIDNF